MRVRVRVCVLTNDSVVTRTDKQWVRWSIDTHLLNAPWLRGSCVHSNIAVGWFKQCTGQTQAVGVGLVWISLAAIYKQYSSYYSVHQYKTAHSWNSWRFIVCEHDMWGVKFYVYDYVNILKCTVADCWWTEMDPVRGYWIIESGQIFYLINSEL